jgi:hypothetical protein
MGPVLIAFMLCIDTGSGFAPGGSAVHVRRDAIVAVLDTLPPSSCSMVVTVNQTRFAVQGTVQEILQKMGSDGG